MCCSECGLDKTIVNKHFKLCLFCNEVRLSGRKVEEKQIVRLQHSKPQPNKTQGKIDEDEKFYELCFNNSNHECEECGAPLPTEFRDSNGKVLARFRYSHIIPKSVMSEYRHYIENINHLCLIHHIQWDHGDKTVMKIYELNRKKFPNFLK